MEKVNKKSIKLIRAITSMDGKDKLNEVIVKDADKITAYDFFDVEFSSTGTVKLGSMASAVANLCNLTDTQVAEMHPKDYIMLTGEVGKYIL